MIKNNNLLSNCNGLYSMEQKNSKSSTGKDLEGISCSPILKNYSRTANMNSGKPLKDRSGLPTSRLRFKHVTS
jgi:hypothetical protein